MIKEQISYELHTLGWKAFQQLCGTILTDIMGQTVQCFSDVNDGGRDLAFFGSWINGDLPTESFSGSFTIQCKHTIDANGNLSLSDVKEEIEKVKRLAKSGLCDNYLIFTNAKITASSESIISSEFQKIDGVNICKVFGGQWINKIIKESPKLRMLIPRIYGLGDLSQIIDSRAYDQANEILSVMGDDVSKFVITDAYSKSVAALTQNNFVLLLGEPACGKSTIAAALVLSSIDRWNAKAIKITSPSEFVQHWNPSEPNQVFWVDDVFGSTQIDHSKTSEWNSKLSHINSAIKRGVKIIFTSRTYIYKQAKEYLKEYAAPILRDSQVTIYVEHISKEEREQILYNHIKLGNQSKNYKREIKHFLSDIVLNPELSPEIARRLGDKNFTSSLAINLKSLTDFISKPMDFLSSTIINLDRHSRAALTILFINGGEIESPISEKSVNSIYFERLGSSIYDVVNAIKFMKGSFTTEFLKNGRYFWKFKHPTIQDSLSEIYSTDREFLHAYLLGADINKIFNEVSCGVTYIDGVKIVVPSEYFNIIIDRIKLLDTKIHLNSIRLAYFISDRCNKDFIEKLISSFPQYIYSLKIYSQLRYCSDLRVIKKLNSLGLISKEKRYEYVSMIGEIAIKQFDSGFFDEKVLSLLSHDEKEKIMLEIKENSIPKLYNEVEDYYHDWNGEDPDDYFSHLESSIETYKENFHDQMISELIEEAEILLKEYKEEIEEKFEFGTSNNINSHSNHHQSNTFCYKRSIFDDVDL